jgi:hypothetical protein
MKPLGYIASGGLLTKMPLCFSGFSFGRFISQYNTRHESTVQALSIAVSE